MKTTSQAEKVAEFSQSSFESDLVRKLVALWHRPGGRRVWNMVACKAKKQLMRHGYSEPVAFDIVTGCREMAGLEIDCEDLDGRI